MFSITLIHRITGEQRVLGNLSIEQYTDVLACYNNQNKWFVIC